MKSSRLKRRKLMQSYFPQRSDLPAIFESLNDDTLTTVLEFVGDKSYRSFGGVNKHCKEIYLSSGMTKETFLYGYAPLAAITDRIERAMRERFNWKVFEKVGKGVVLYNRRDVLDWALEEQEKIVLKGICYVASCEERFDVLEEMWNNIEDDDDKEDVFGIVDRSAAQNGKLNVLKWLETKGFAIVEYDCAKEAAWHGQLHILQWLSEEKDLELFGLLYNCALAFDHLRVMKWLREQGCAWDENIFMKAAEVGNLDILQWLHVEGCPWSEYIRVCEKDLKPEVVNWCRANGYGDMVVY